MEEAEVEQFGVEREREVKGGVLMTDVRDDLNEDMKIVTVLEEEEEEEAERESAGLLWWPLKDDAKKKSNVFTNRNPNTVLLSGVPVPEWIKGLETKSPTDTDTQNSCLHYSLLHFPLQFIISLLLHNIN